MSVDVQEQAEGNGPSVTAVVWAVADPENWLETVQSLCEMATISKVYFCLHFVDAKARNILRHPKLSIVDSISLASFVNEQLPPTDQVLFVTDPIALAPDALDRAVPWMNDDPRIGTISFLSNAAGYLSFPHRNSHSPVPPQGHNEVTLNKRLRERAPDSGLTPIATPEGAAILVSSGALSTSGGIEDWPDANPSLTLFEFGLRASRRGFNNFLDAGTFIWRTSELIEPSPLAMDGLRHDLHCKYRFFPNLHDFQKYSQRGPLAHALDLARVKAQGVRVLIDGSALGPQEMGTQLLIVALTSELAKHPEIQSVALGVPDPGSLPGYAQFLRSQNKITFHREDGLTFPGAPEVDIIHRPYQPTRPIPWERWRSLGKRSVITIQDLIGYRNGAYFARGHEWMEYRQNLEQQVAQADAIFSISHDVLGPIREERLQVAEDALFVVENGVDFRSMDEEIALPASVSALNWQAEPYLLVLGTNYAHKNRDLALRIWKQLQKRGQNLKIILVGANVPQGSTRLDEFRTLGKRDGDSLVLPDVVAEERNWLLRHAALVLYPTAAEGFGQIPFEAARFGRPSVYVSFGPLRELSGDQHAPRQFNLEQLTDRAEHLLTDPAAARQAVADTLKHIDQYTWARTAERSVEAYFQILGRPGK
jgi:glycosyltransferase involved in cell wall biosynthesis